MLNCVRNQELRSKPSTYLAYHLIMKHRTSVTVIRTVALTCMLLLPLLLTAQHRSTIRNFNADHQQTLRLSAAGNAIDAHDGEIAQFNGVYYLYGTSYDCGFEWGNKTAPFCGFKTYSSTDLVHWKDLGAMFNAQNTVWQTRCNGSTYGCFRPHVVYNRKTKLYVLWINVYDNVSGYRVFTSKAPAGPFTEVAAPKLAVNSTAPAAGLNNGDHDVFVDDDGTAYLAYTDWRTQGSIVVEKLSADYLSGTGVYTASITQGNTEAPSLFKRGHDYYLIYSDPNCGYCDGTGASYRRAKAPLGPWSDGVKISDNSCGGQPSFVSVINLQKGQLFIFGSDLWNKAAKNEALANYYWAPLSFDSTGAILPMVCMDTVALPIASGTTENAMVSIQSCNIKAGASYTQPFTISKSGTLKTLRFLAFQNGHPDAGLIATLHAADKNGNATGAALYSTTIATGKIGWSPKNIVIQPTIRVTAKQRLVLTLSTATGKGCYGTAGSNSALQMHTVIQ